MTNTPISSFVALTKRGDEKFTKFGKLLDKLGSTPMGLLEQQAKARHFSTRFFLVEEREATSTTPPLVVIEVSAVVDWAYNFCVTYILSLCIPCDTRACRICLCRYICSPM